MADLWTQLRQAHDAIADRSAPGSAPEHRPQVAVLCCSDARVPPSVIFDQPPGSMFVVRLAGNTATPSAVASLDYAVEHLGIELLVVLGHTDCGAVRAAREGHCEGIFGAVTSPICDIVAAHPGEDADLTAARNVTRTVVDLEAHDGPTGRAIRDGRVRIEGAIHDVRSARLRSPDSFLATRTTLTTPTITTPTS